MALNIWALTIVKATGAEVPAVQLVFLRAATGLCLMLTWIALAALFLGERATPRRWAAAGIGLIGVLVAARPNGAGPDPALLALAVTVVTGTAAIVVTRRLNDQPTVVMMTAYTAGLALATAPLAWLGRVPVAPNLWPVLLAIGVASQAAQFCFLQAHRRAEAGVLAILGYASLILSTTVGWLVLSEVPPTGFWVGAALIVVASRIARHPPGPRHPTGA